MGVRKYILRRAMEKALPGKIIHRYKKMGFPTPQLDWIEVYDKYFLKLAQKATERHPDILSIHFHSQARDWIKKRQRHYYPLIWRVITFSVWQKASGW